MISPNMLLTIPAVGIVYGPEWAQQLNDSLTLIDSHNHAPGAGVPINPDGLDINSDLSFNSNNATSMRAVRFTAQTSTFSLAADSGSIYRVDSDLYYRDGSGNNVRITQSGGVAGSPGSIANLTSPASASYVALSQKFVWQSAANTPANMDAAAYIFRNLTANSKGLTLSPPAAMAVDYDLTLPSLPASQKIMTLDSSGAMSAPYTVDGSTITISSNVIGVPNSGINTNQIANGAVTPIKQSAKNYFLSSSSGAFVTTSGSPVAITNFSGSITTVGRPVMIQFVAADTNAASIGVDAGVAGTIRTIITLQRDAVDIAQFELRGLDLKNLDVPPGAIQFLDTPAAGTYTYSALTRVASGSDAYVTHCKLLIYEM